VYVAHDRGGRSRLQHFEGTFTVAGSFELRSPVQTTAAPSDDGASRLSGRYEYRQYTWLDLGRRVSTSALASKAPAST
jgi:hypothetical protein